MRQDREFSNEWGYGNTTPSAAYPFNFSGAHELPAWLKINISLLGHPKLITATLAVINCMHPYEIVVTANNRVNDFRAVKVEAGQVPEYVISYEWDEGHEGAEPGDSIKWDTWIETDDRHHFRIDFGDHGSGYVIGLFDNK